jgi:hypothetical protein
LGKIIWASLCGKLNCDAAKKVAVALQLQLSEAVMAYFKVLYLIHEIQEKYENTTFYKLLFKHMLVRKFK